MNMFVKVGVSVIIVNSDSLLLGKRKGSHGNGTWAPPGGHNYYRKLIFRHLKTNNLYRFCLYKTFDIYIT